MCSSVLFWVNLWSCSQLWAAKWLLGIEPCSSGRAASAFFQSCKFIFLSLFLSSVKWAHCSHSTVAFFYFVLFSCCVWCSWCGLWWSFSAILNVSTCPWLSTHPFSNFSSLFCNLMCPESKKLSLYELRTMTLGHTLFQTCVSTVSPRTGPSLSQGGWGLSWWLGTGPRSEMR